MTKDANITQMPANRMPLSDRIKKLTDTIRIHVKKPYGENKDDVELHEVVDGGNVIATFLKREGEILQSNASPDLQQSGLDEKVNKAVGAKAGDTTSTSPVESAKDTKDAKQMAPERPKEHESREAEGKEKIKAPDSKEKKPKDPKEGKKPDNSMSKMASAESAETQGAAPLEKNYKIKRVGDTLHYSRLGDDKKPQAPVPPQPVQTPSPTETKPAATGPDQPAGTSASPQQPPAAAASASPAAKQPEGTRWKKLFAARNEQRVRLKAEKAGAQVMGRKGELFVKSEAPLKKDVVEFPKKKQPETPKSTSGSHADKVERIRGSLEKINRLMTAMREHSEAGKTQPSAEQPKKTGHQGMFDVLGRGKPEIKPGSRDQKIKAALDAQGAAGSPYATKRDDQGKGGTQGIAPKAADPKPAPKKVNASGPATVTPIRPQAEPPKPVLIRDMNRLKGHTKTGRPFRVLMATHQDHASLPGYHMGLDQEHSINQIKKHLSNPIHPITKAVYAALERGHDKLIVHNPNQPFKSVK